MKLNRNLSGIVLIVIAVFILSSSDAIYKYYSADFSVSQLFFIRSSCAAIIILAISVVWRQTLSLNAPKWVLLRSLLLTIMWLCYYSALPMVPFTLAAAALYTTPFFMALFAAVFLKEPIGLFKWVGIAIGFTGVIIILQPDIEGPSLMILLPFVSAACYAGAALITWTRCIGENALAMSMNLNVLLALSGLIAIGLLWAAEPNASLVLDYPFIFRPWPDLTLTDFLIIAMLGLLLVIITASVAKAYQQAPSHIIGVFDNSYIVFAALWGILIFGETPTVLTLAGMALVCIGAIVTVVTD